MTAMSRFSAWIAIAIVTFTNFLFADKYFSRFSDWGLLAALGYTLGFTAILVALPKTARHHWTRNRFFLLLGTASLFWIVIFFLTDVTTLRVDRWYMIDTFLNNLFAGIYPYTPNPNSNIPSPFPFYYALAMPFYLNGEIGYWSIVGLLLYALFARNVLKLSQAKSFWIIVALLLSVSFDWEMYTRSTLFINMVIVVGYCYALLKARLTTRLDWLMLGLCGGLVLATRAIAIIPIAVCAIYRFKREMNWNRFLAFGAMAALGFLGTLLPLYLWSPELFFKYNPLLVESFFLPKVIVLAILATSILAGFHANTPRDCLFYAGLLIFASVGLGFALSILSFGWDRTIFQTTFDISYFLLPLPFVMLFLYDEQVARGEPASRVL